MKLLITLILIANAYAGCSQNNMQISTDTTKTRSYLALGDSYTIGETVPIESSFPYQLAAELGQNGHAVSKPEIIATTGWTTDELIDAINNSSIQGKKYNLVTLLIGVNNQYRDYSQAVYRKEFVQLLNTAIGFADGNKKNVFVLSIPDWGVTPYADVRDRAQITKEIEQFNAINKQETQSAGVTWVDITSISKQAAADPTLTAEDGLHPSAKMYGLWVKELIRGVLSRLKKN